MKYEKNETKKIMLVDDNVANLAAGKTILKDSYKVYPAPSAELMFDMLETVNPNLILLDIEMPEKNGYEALREIKATPKFSNTPVIFLTSRTDEGSELEGLSLGAIDYIYKPFSAPLLLKRIENHLFVEEQRIQLQNFNENLEKMVFQKTEHVMNLQSAVLSTVADLVEYRDDITGGHVSRTQNYLKIMVDQMIAEEIYADEIAACDMQYFFQSAQLHDVGKIGISDLILNKPGKLTAEEFEIMKTHPAIGVSAIKRIEKNANEHSFLKHARLFAGSHHEKWDGSGYPAGLSGTDIPLEGRIMAIADVYDALISPRPYKKPFHTEVAKKIILEGIGSHFDPALITIFEKVAPRFEMVAKDGYY